MKIAVIVLNWNGEGYISRCLESLVKLKKSSHQLEIIVVDNNSSDNSLSLISKFPVKIIRNSKNYGYAEGNNIGIREGQKNRPDFFWIVNPDIELDPNALISLVVAAKTYPHAGIFGSKIYFKSGYEFHKDKYQKSDLGRVIWFAGGRIDWKNVASEHIGVDQVDHGQFDKDAKSDFITGASMFIRSEVFDKVGLLNSKYFLYFEENDLCQRARKFGFDLMYSYKSVAWHANAQATGIGSDLQDYYITRNRLMFGISHAPFRTKIALIRQSIWQLINGRKWQKKGVLDYYFNNLGKGSYA